MNRYNQILKLLQSLSDKEITNLLNSLEENKQNLEVSNIEKFLKELCVNPSLLGFNYLKDAIELCLENKEMLNSITKSLYPTVAKKNNTTPSRVERAIRHAIDTSWDKIDGETYHEVFFNEMERLTNSKYIAYACNYINSLQNINDKPKQKIL